MRFGYVFSFLFVALTTSLANAGPLKLIYADVLWRHGTRAPDHLYATSLNKESDFPPGLGELVPQGVLDHISLGKKLGQRFISKTGLLSASYIAKEVKVISTPIDRTIASATANFAGFYGFSTTLTGSQTFTPVAVYPEGAVWMNWTLCPAQQEFVQVVVESDKYAEFHSDFVALRKTLSQNSGTNVTENDNLASGICDAIKFELLNHKPIATWAALIQPQCDQLRKRYYELQLGFVDFTYKNVSMKNLARKLFSGITFDVIDRIQSQYDAYQNLNASGVFPKYYASSIHDIHLSLLSLGLGFPYLSFTEDRWVGLAEAISFELWATDGGDDNIVKVWYYQNNKEDPVELTQLIPACKGTDSGCSIQKLYNELKKFENTDFSTFCAASLDDIIQGLDN